MLSIPIVHSHGSRFPLPLPLPFPPHYSILPRTLPGSNTPRLYREYPEQKLQENLDAEIFGILIEEAKEAYDEEIVVELKSETDEDIEENCARVCRWIEVWKGQNKADEEG
jgi:broad-specificity NMP kinase